MTLVETARLLAFIGARDNWAPNDYTVQVWHHQGTDGVDFDLAMDRILDHEGRHQIALCCLLGNCNPADDHDSLEPPNDAIASMVEQIAWRQEAHDRYRVGGPLTEQSFAFMVKTVGPQALDIYRAAVDAMGDA